MDAPGRRVSTTWNEDASGPSYWDWLRQYFTDEQRQFSIEGTEDPTYGPDTVEATASCVECGALVASSSLGNLNAHRAFHDKLNGVN